MHKLPKLITASCLAMVLLFAVGCRGKSAKLQSSAVPPDKTLFENGVEWMNKSQFTKARLAFQTLINTYPDSELTSKAFFAIADSYYKEGGREALLQAEAQYKDFMVFYPTHEKVAESQLKIAALNMRMMEDPDRDPTYAKRAEVELKKFIEQFPDHNLMPEAKEKLRAVQENLAEGMYGKGEYYHRKKNYKASAARFRELTEKYPRYSKIDVVLAELGDDLIKQERTDEAVAVYQKLASAYEGPSADMARKRLEELGRPILPVDPVQVAENRKNGKPKEGFSLTAPIREAISAFRPGPDPYKEMTEAAALRTQASKEKPEGTLAQSKEGGYQIEAVIAKSADKEATTKATVIQPNTSSNTPTTGNGQNQKSDSTGKEDKSKTKKKKGLVKRIFRQGP